MVGSGIKTDQPICDGMAPTLMGFLAFQCFGGKGAYAPEFTNAHRGKAMNRVDLSGECWIWQGRVNNKGYGCLSIKGVEFLAHRVSYILHVGTIPQALLVCHTCDNRRCVNPAHFFLGTDQENKDDASAKRLARCQHLTAKQVHDIRSSHLTQRELGKKYGLTQSGISGIQLRKTWRHV